MEGEVDRKIEGVDPPLERRTGRQRQLTQGSDRRRGGTGQMEGEKMQRGETEIRRETITNRERRAGDTTEGQTAERAERQPCCGGVVDGQRGSVGRKRGTDRLRNRQGGRPIEASGGRRRAVRPSNKQEIQLVDRQMDTARHIPRGWEQTHQQKERQGDRGSG